MFETPQFAPDCLDAQPVMFAKPAALAFDEFVVDGGNHTVAAACEQLIHAPTLGPLVVSGPSGSGKSLVLHELSTAWLKARSNDVVISLKGAEFAEQYAAAVDDDRVSAFRRRLSDCDLLLIDGLQQLHGKPSAQSELLRVLDALEDRSAAALTLDVTPARCGSLMPALIGRLIGGIVVSLAQPSTAARREILRRRAAFTSDAVDNDALERLAADRTLDVPEMIGRFVSWRQSAIVAGRTLDGPYVRELSQRQAAEVRPSLKQVAEATARRFELTVADLKSRSRRRTVVAARDAAMLLGRRLTGATLQEVGKYFGNRDHTTVLHSCHKLEAVAERDAELRTTLDAIRRAIRC